MSVVLRHIAVALLVSFGAWLKALWLGDWVEVGKAESGGQGHFAGFKFALNGRTLEGGEIGGRALECFDLGELTRLGGWAGVLFCHGDFLHDLKSALTECLDGGVVLTEVALL